MGSNQSPKIAVVFDRIIDSLAFLTAILVVAIMVVMCYEVIMRYFLHAPPPWAVEVSEYMIFSITFLGAAWALKLGKHVRVDLVVGSLNLKAQTLLNTITSALGVIVCFLITCFAGEATWVYFREGIPVVQVLRVPKFIFLAVITIGMLLLAIQFLRQSYGSLISWRAQANKEQES